jgi:hypothetical protein
VGQELVDGVEGVGLHGVVGGKNDEHWDIGLAENMRLWSEFVRRPRLLTGLNPPGGLALAQLQFGSLHLEASQEYPAAAELDVAPLIDPSSCANASSAENPRRRSARGSMAATFFFFRF